MALCTAQYTLHPFLHFPALALWYRRLNRDSSEVLRGPDSFFLCQSHLRSENKFFNVKRLNISVKHISKVVIIVPLDADFFKLAFYLSTIYKVDRRGSACVTSRRNSLKKNILGTIFICKRLLYSTHETTASTIVLCTCHKKKVFFFD